MMAQAIIREGAKAVAAGMNPMDLKRGLDIAVEAVVADMKRRSRQVSGREDIAQVGTISASSSGNSARTCLDLARAAIIEIGRLLPSLRGDQRNATEGQLPVFTVRGGPAGCWIKRLLSDGRYVQIS